MHNWLSQSLLRKLIAMFLCAALVPVAVVAGLAYQKGRQGLVHRTQDLLQSVVEARMQVLSVYFDALHHNLDTLTEFHSLDAAATSLRDFDAAMATQGSTFDTSGEDYRKLADETRASLTGQLKALDFANVYLLCAPHGHIMWQWKPESDLGSDVRGGAARDTGLARAWSRALVEDEVVFEDFTRYPPLNHAPALFLAVAVRDEAGKIAAVLAARWDDAFLHTTADDRTGLGKTGETHVVGRDKLLRTDSRLDEHVQVLQTAMDTPAVVEALNGKSGTLSGADHRGVHVLSAYGPAGLKEHHGLDWAIVSEMDESEALSEVLELERAMLVVALLVALGVVLGAFLAARGIARPLSRLAAVASRMATGDLTVTVDASKRLDEVGGLLTAFREMVGALRKQTGEVTETAETVGAASAEISASVAQLAASVQQTASAVSETTATTEEVKQTTGLASEKARLLEENARKSSQVAASGVKATDDMAQRMKKLQDQINEIAGRMIKLSEKRQAIGQITSTVGELADQSNLLAVNAAIEAAKAGEHGKGFAVVAQEVRTLAERSKQATAEIKAILGDIEKSTTAAVMATEQGTKAVETGMKQASETGEVIRNLARAIDESAVAASQIMASAKQQALGMDQTASSMESIKQASTQNAASTKQLQEAAMSLKNVGQVLRDLVKRYTL
jgi:methyl-accepting chemotaxis protein